MGNSDVSSLCIESFLVVPLCEGACGIECKGSSMKFSERQGLLPVRSVLQTDGIDGPLRNGLWDALHFFFFSKEEDWTYAEDSEYFMVFNRIWHLYFKRPVDTLPEKVGDVRAELRKYFFGSDWFAAYDLIEFLEGELEGERSKSFAKFVNAIMERELSAYRLIDGQVTPISSEEEVSSIEGALRNTGQLIGPHTHLKSAIAHLASRSAPDFRNSMKESISAVESVCKLIAGKPKATLGEALQALEKGGVIHPALKQSFSALYGYASDADGIRHAMTDAPSVDLIDAKYMLVSCAAFINYLIGKAAAGEVDIGA